MTTPERILERYINAVRTLDRAAMLELYSPDLRMFDMTAPWQFANRKEFEPRLNEWFSSSLEEPNAIARDVQSSIDGNLAYMSLFIDYVDTNEDGEQDAITNRLTWVLARNGDDWKIIHEHTSVPLSEDDDAMSPVFEMK